MGRSRALEVEADGAALALHLLLPAGTRPAGLRWGGKAAAFEAVQVEASPYVDAAGRVEGEAAIEVTYADA